MGERLLRLAEVQRQTGLCRSAVYATPSFPKGIKLGSGRAVAWIASEVEAWIQATIAASRAGDKAA